jgi:histidinol dehydrogenase
MSAISAEVAGVERFVAWSPPGSVGEPNPGILYDVQDGSRRALPPNGAEAIGALSTVATEI